MTTPTLTESARQREREAWDARFKHVKAANTWRAIAGEQPESRELSEILATWMAAYADADAEAEQAFRVLAARQDQSEPTP